MNTFSLFRCLRNPVFARLYAAQTINLLGDAFTWLGLALLAFELAPTHSGIVLSFAFTLRVSAFVILSPLAGAIADRMDRKLILTVTHLLRMFLVCLLPFVHQLWQLYLIVLLLNSLYAFFTPTYKATIPQVTGTQDYSQAIALSGATYEFIGVLGPGLAGAIATFINVREIFFLDGMTFLVATILILTLPGSLRVIENSSSDRGRTWRSIKEGTVRLWSDQPIRYALMMQLVASIAGAEILVNTVGYVKNSLGLGNTEYGWVMSAFGIGATLGAVAFGILNFSLQRTTLTLIGATLISLTMLVANSANLTILLILWVIAGIGQNLVNLPTQTLIAERIPTYLQGRVYGAHFAWSHLWWAISYPLAGWLASQSSEQFFFYSSLIGLTLLGLVQLLFSSRQHKHEHTHEELWHEHDHVHDEHHQHEHEPGSPLEESHSHRHFHPLLRHTHPHLHDVHHSHQH